jgi:hypothetical protein
MNNHNIIATVIDGSMCKKKYVSPQRLTWDPPTHRPKLQLGKKETEIWKTQFIHLAEHSKEFELVCVCLLASFSCQGLHLK